LEREWDADKLQKKIAEYLKKAAKGVPSRGAWQEIASEFGMKFFEAFWRALGEREWLDQVDFTYIVGLGFKAYCDVPSLMNVSEEEYMTHIALATEAGFDASRYYSWSWQVLKNIVPGKKTQSTVRNAVDEAREKVRQVWPETPPLFCDAWVAATLEELAKCGSPMDNLDPNIAVQLFSAMIKDGGGIPLALMQTSEAPTPEEIQNSVSQAYAAYGFGGAMGGAFGKGLIPPAMGGKGCGKWGGGPY